MPDGKGRLMPPKDLHRSPELHMLQPDGTWVKLGKIEKAQITSSEPCDPYDDSPFISMREQTVTFNVTWNPSGDMVYLLIHGRLPSNNWRRMHGYPMKRKERQRERIYKNRNSVQQRCGRHKETD